MLLNSCLTDAVHVMESTALEVMVQLAVRDVPKTEFNFRSCYHCEDLFCVPICPTGPCKRATTNLGQGGAFGDRGSPREV